MSQRVDRLCLLSRSQSGGVTLPALSFALGKHGAKLRGVGVLTVVRVYAKKLLNLEGFIIRSAGMLYRYLAVVMAEPACTHRTILLLELLQTSGKAFSGSYTLHGCNVGPQQPRVACLAEIAASLRPISGLPTCEGAALRLAELP